MIIFVNLLSAALAAGQDKIIYSLLYPRVNKSETKFRLNSEYPYLTPTSENRYMQPLCQADHTITISGLVASWAHTYVYRFVFDGMLSRIRCVICTSCKDYYPQLLGFPLIIATKDFMFRRKGW
jgi:hypothetical protein